MASAKTGPLPNISRSFVTTRGVGFGIDRSGGGGECRRARAGGVEAVVGGVGGQERRTLLGVGTYLIDTPRDSGLYLRQQFLNHQEQHRGVPRSQEEVLPEIPFRLHPRPEHAQSSVIDIHPQVSTMDVATSPMTPFEEESNPPPTRASSPIPPPTRSVTFMTDREVTSLSMTTTRDVSGVTSKARKNRGTSMGVFSRENGDLRSKRETINQFRERSKERSSSATGTGNSDQTGHMTERLPRLPLTGRDETFSMKKSSSVTDLTDVGSMFSWRDKDFEVKSSRSFDLTSENIGHTSYLQRNKTKSLGDLLKPAKEDNDKVSDLAAYHKRQRIAQLAFRRENTVRRNSTLSGIDADKEWLDMRNTQLVDKTEYEKFASRRKPSSSAGKKSKKTYSPRSSTEFSLTHPVGGKVYPVFYNDGSPVRKFGRPSAAAVNVYRVVGMKCTVPVRLEEVDENFSPDRIHVGIVTMDPATQSFSDVMIALNLSSAYIISATFVQYPDEEKVSSDVGAALCSV
ncbi:hypothetical protein BaRGS_00025029, partial [Batillaria attramentaria]